MANPTYNLSRETVSVFELAGRLPRYRECISLWASNLSYPIWGELLYRQLSLRGSLKSLKVEMPLPVFSELAQRPSFITACPKFQSFSAFYCYKSSYFLPCGFPMPKSVSPFVPSNGKQGRPRPYDIHSTLLDHSLRCPGLRGVPFSPGLKHF